MEPTQPDVAIARPTMRHPRPPQVISSSNPNKKKSPSTSWDHFEKFIDEEGRTNARCIYCSKEYIANRKVYGTSNLKNHTPFVMSIILMNCMMEQTHCPRMYRREI